MDVKLRGTDLVLPLENKNKNQNWELVKLEVAFAKTSYGWLYYMGITINFRR